jgi:hypothetical protein
VLVDEGVRGEQGGPGSGKAAAPEHRLGRHARQDILDELVGDVLVAWRRRRRPRLLQWWSHRSLPRSDSDLIDLFRSAGAAGVEGSCI